MKDTQIKAAQITINNPDEHGYTEDKITEILAQNRIIYACFCREIGEHGTEHIHIYVVFRSARRFSTLHKRFPKAHIEKALGSPSDNRDYILKKGKWADTAKAETSIEGSFREFGELPEDSFLSRMSDMEEIIDEIKAGSSTADIIESHPKQLMKATNIDTARQAFLAQKYKSKYRNVTVTYVYAPIGVDKTRRIYEEFPAKDICRITNYDRRNMKFDSYHGEDVLVFEEFEEQLPITEMLCYLDGYPLMLPARYNDRVACYTKVFITSRLEHYMQYNDAVKVSKRNYAAFQERIDNVEIINYDGSIQRYDLNKGECPQYDE